MFPHFEILFKIEEMALGSGCSSNNGSWQINNSEATSSNSYFTKKMLKIHKKFVRSVN